MNSDHDTLEINGTELFTLMSCVALKRLKSQGWSALEALKIGRSLSRQITEAIPGLMEEIEKELFAAHAANGFNEEIFKTMVSAAAAVRAVELADSCDKRPQESLN